MHDPGAYVEVSTLFPFLVIFILASFGIVNLVKLTAGRFLNTLRLEGVAAEDRLAKKEESASMIEGHGVCEVCGRVSTKRCSQCKAVRYCSLNCQRAHWNQGHKKECRPAKAPDPVHLKNASGMLQSNASLGKKPTNGTLLGTATGISDGIPPKPNKVLFPYDEFIKLFNWDKLRLPPCGLLNCGNSCFANVVLQCLTYTRPLVAYLLEANHMHTCTRNDWCFLCELQHHVEMVNQSVNPFSPIRILSRIPNIGGNLGYGRQEDAHEFMRFAIDSMQSICLDEFGGEKVVDPHTQETTLIQHIFGGQLRSQVKCTQCHRVSNRYENMMDLTVEIHGDVASLEDALEQFTACEWLDGENKYKCDGCNAYVKAWKQLTVYQAPNVLTVALKRFQTGRFGKLNKRVTFPETLDLSSYVSGREDGLHIYKLYAVVVHVDMLNASFFGHYICYIKDLHGTWYKIDDCKVKEVELEEVLSQRAYMLLYSRISVRPPPVAAGISAPAVIKVVEPLRDNLGDAQESSAAKSVRHSLSTRVAPENSQNVMGSLHIEDTESLSVEMMAEESGSLTSNSSCSEGSSVKNVKMSLDSPISLEPKLLATGLFPVVPARKHRGASCPPTMVGGRLDFGIPTPSSGVRGIKQSASLNNLNNGSNAAVLGMGSLMKNGLDDKSNILGSEGPYLDTPRKNGLDDKSNILGSQGPYLDTPRTSDLTEAGNSRVLDLQSCDSDMVGPEKMDCDSQIIHPSTENSCDGLLTFLEEPALDEIADSFSQRMPSSINASFSDENADILVHSSSGMGQILKENQYDIVPGHGDQYDDSGKASDLIDADMIDNGKCDPESEIHPVKDTSLEMNFTEETLGVDSLPRVLHSPAHLSHAYAGELIESDQMQEKISLTPEKGISGIYSESVSLNREFPNEGGVVEEVTDSTLEQGVSPSDLLFKHSVKDTGIDKAGQDSLPRNPGIDILDGSASFPEFSANSGDGAKIISSDSSQLGKAICTPVKRSPKSKPIFVPGFLKKASRIQTVADSRPSQDRDTHPDAPNGTGSAHEKSCSPVDATGLETPDFVQFEANSGMDVMGTHPCPTPSTEAGNGKAKPIFARGFLNRPSATQFKSSKKKTVHAIQMDRSSSENGMPKFQDFLPNKVICNGTEPMCKIVAGNGVSDSAPICTFSNKPELEQSGMQVDWGNVAAISPQNGGENAVGNFFTSNQKELIGSGRKRSLSSEFRHTEQGGSASLKTNGNVISAKQKQVRNGSCHCGSQRKWKKCCGRAGVLGHT